MKKLVLIALIVTSFSYGQLHVSTGSYVYVKNQQVFVGDFGDTDSDISLAGTAGDYTQTNNGFIFLRDEAQLFQTFGTNSVPNTGAGKLSVLQEGTANEFSYNFWGSPVQDPEETQGVGFNTTLGFYDPDIDDLNPTVASLINGSNGQASPLAISARWLFQYAFDDASDNTRFQYVGSSDVTGVAVLPGLGYTMKGTNGTSTANPGSNQQYDFRGKPNTGTINVAVVDDNFTLVGNPYPSAMNLQDFLLDADNTEIEATAYFWQQDRSTMSHRTDSYIGGYGTYVPSPGIGLFTQATFTAFDGNGDIVGGPLANTDQTTISRQFIPIGQGFFVFGNLDGDVDADGDGDAITFKNTYREFIQEESTGESVFQEIEQFDDDELLGNTKEAGQSNNSNNAENQNARGDLIISDQYIQDYSVLYFDVIIENDNLLKPIALSFFERASDSFDRGADGVDISGLRNNVYWPIESKKYVIQGTNFDIDKEIPLGFTVADRSTIEIKIKEKDNFDSSILVFVLDRESGLTHNITNDSYLLKLEPGTYEDRFAITFVQGPKAEDSDDDTTEDEDTTEDDSTDDDENAEDLLEELSTEFIAFQDNLNKQLVIENNGGLNIRSISMYDVSGRVMFSDVKNSTDRSITYGTNQYSTGVYVVSIILNDNQNITKKVLIKN